MASSSVDRWVAKITDYETLTLANDSLSFKSTHNISLDAFGLCLYNFDVKLRGANYYSVRYNESVKFNWLLSELGVTCPLIFASSKFDKQAYVAFDHLSDLLYAILASDIEDQRLRTVVSDMVKHDLPKKIVDAIEKRKLKDIAFHIKDMRKNLADLEEFMTLHRDSLISFDANKWFGDHEFALTGINADLKAARNAVVEFTEKIKKQRTQ